ncbi:T-complex protein 1 [Trichophyton tonsurans CBS 112818]|uniref:T-complex protein 1 n=1 Tax=Trichophyton tonsurans (strain CBS 112818) TaxID=647933 RepID=F2S006_TRIT1|nr:T-complex protein 1 [Trichophyton tonsurans CBS 112818]
MAFAGQTPTIIVLKEGTDASQGKGQILSNINACVAVQNTIKSTLGPYGGDLLLVDTNGKQTITNDGATVMKLLDIVHPAARILTDIARSQDAEVGDGTTSVVVLAGEILREVRDLVEQDVSAQTIIKGLRKASAMCINRIKEIAIDMKDAAGGEAKKIETLRRLAGTAMNSKLIKRNSDFFTKMVVDAVLSLDQDDLNEKLIGVKKITGGALQDSQFINGVAFKKTFSYAGFEQQPKSFKNPKIVCLNVELELKSEKDNAEVRVEQVSEYQAIVDAEWQIIFNKLEALYKTGAKVVLIFRSLSVTLQHTALRNTNVVPRVQPRWTCPGYIHRYADVNVPHKQQAVVKAFAKALEVIPRQLCDNAGFDATDILNQLRVEHKKGNIWAGVDFDREGVRDNMKAFVWEPSLVKVNAIQSAVEAACLILSVDETIKNEESAQPQGPPQALPQGAAQRVLRGGRGRGMPRR